MDLREHVEEVVDVLIVHLAVEGDRLLTLFSHHNQGRIGLHFVLFDYRGFCGSHDAKVDSFLEVLGESSNSQGHSLFFVREKEHLGLRWRIFEECVQVVLGNLDCLVFDIAGGGFSHFADIKVLGAEVHDRHRVLGIYSDYRVLSDTLFGTDVWLVVAGDGAHKHEALNCGTQSLEVGLDTGLREVVVDLVEMHH